MEDLSKSCLDEGCFWLFFVEKSAWKKVSGRRIYERVEKLYTIFFLVSVLVCCIKKKKLLGLVYFKRTRIY